MNEIVLFNVPLIAFLNCLKVMIEFVNFIDVLSKIFNDVWTTFLIVRNEAVDLIYNIRFYVFNSVEVVYCLSIVFRLLWNIKIVLYFLNRSLLSIAFKILLIFKQVIVPRKTWFLGFYFNLS